MLPHGKIIGVVSFKGGVGKTTTAINVGVSLARLGKNVVVVDCNFSSPNLNVYLGLLRPEMTLDKVLAENKDIGEAIYRHQMGIDVVPTSYSDSVDARRFKDKIRGLRKHYDYVLIDSGPNVKGEMAACFSTADEFLFLTTPDYATLATTLRAAGVAKQRSMKVRGVIINKKRGKKFELTKTDIEKTVNLPVLAEFLDGNEIQEAGSNFSSVVDFAPRSRNSKEYMRLARKISGEKEIEKEGYYSMLAGLFNSGLEKTKGIFRRPGR
jgi:septum site-determining protein MinD